MDCYSLDDSQAKKEGENDKVVMPKKSYHPFITDKPIPSMTMISTDILDHHLAPNDYCERICLVRTSFDDDNSNNNSNMDTIVNKYKLWPALQYTTIHDLMYDIDQHIPNDTSPSLLPCSSSLAVTRKKYKAMIHVQYMKLLYRQQQRRRDNDNNLEDSDDDASLRIVYRIGWNYHHQEEEGGGGGATTTTTTTAATKVGDDDELFCIQFINNNNNAVYDYYDNVDDMDAAIGSSTHCGSSTFQRVHKLVMGRISKGAGDEKGLLALITSIRGHSTTTTPSLSYSPATRKKKKTTTKDRDIKYEEMTTAKKVVLNVEKASSITRPTTTTTHSLTSPSKASRTSPRWKSSKSDNVNDNNEMLLTQDSSTRPVETVMFSHGGGGCGSSSGSLSSPDRSEVSNKSSVAASVDRKNNNTRNIPKKEQVNNNSILSWTEMFDQMKFNGWTWLPGSGGSDLVDWYYLHPSCKGLPKPVLLRTKVEGVDYFTSIDAVKRYAILHLSWNDGGVCGISTMAAGGTNSSQDAELVDRIKKRKRGGTTADLALAVWKRQQHHGITSNTKKKRSTTKAGGTMQANVVKKKRTTATPPKITPTSPYSQDGSKSLSSKDSRFSNSGSSSSRFSLRTRSTLDSPTVSELEMDIGVSNTKSTTKVKKRTNIKSTLSTTKSLKFTTPMGGKGVAKSNSTTVRRGGSGSAGAFVDGGMESSSPSDQSSVDRTYQIMSGINAWKLLQECFNFRMHGGMYCLPGKENRPGKDSTAIEGVNYFSSLDGMRKHLCAWGLPELKRELTTEERSDIITWVRWANVVGLPDAAIINPDVIGDVPESFLPAWSMLRKLGLKFNSSSMCYLYPNPESSDDPTKAPSSISFNNAEKFAAHIARFGIPHVNGIDPNTALSKSERLRLDICIANTDIDTFTRFNPNDNIENAYVTPLKPRRSRGAESSLVEPDKKNSNKPEKNTLKQRPYQMEFNQLRKQRTLPIQLISSQTALSTLVEYYNIKFIQRDGVEQLCLPLTEGDCYFENLQVLRENLCAFGLPPMVKGAATNDEKERVEKLEYWIRCANISALRKPGAVVPQEVNMQPKVARKILKGLGYTVSSLYMLPGTLSHESRLGYDHFDKLLDLFNHIAKFGLVDFRPYLCENPKYAFSDDDMLKFEILVVSGATNDVSKRTDETYAPIRKSGACRGNVCSGVIKTSAVKSKHTSWAAAESNATTKARAAAATPNYPAVVDDEQVTPVPSPKKKPAINSITKYLSAKPNNASKLPSIAPAEDHCDEIQSASSSMDSLSPSCIDTKGDDEVEACLAESSGSESSVLKRRRPDNDTLNAPYEGQSVDDGSTSTDTPTMKMTRTSPRRSNHVSKLSSSSPRGEDNVSSQPSSEYYEYESPPDLQHTVRDKLECCQMVLHPSFNMKQLSKSSSSSVVSSKEHGIKDFLEKSIMTGAAIDGMTLPSPGFLYICGGPGTGKTTAVASCADEMTKWARFNGYEKPLICSVNMAATQSNNSKGGGIMRTMLKKVAIGLQITSDEPLEKYERLMRKKVVVLIVDEIDMLFKQHGGVGETWFKTLISWAEDKEMRFSLIGISNCVNDTNSTRVRELGHSPRELVFPTYKEDDILAILEQRLGKHVIDHKALQLISRRVAASSGDARRALEITSNAVSKCLDLLNGNSIILDTKVKYNDEQHMPLVKLPHMMRAIRETMPMRHTDVISGLPQAAKVILCISVSLSQVWGPTAKISISTLKKYCVEATQHAIMDEVGPGHIASLVEMLVDSGLLVTDISHNFNPNDANSKLKIGVQLDDVEIALEESLLKEGGFYRSLVDYVKRECPHSSSP